MCVILRLHFYCFTFQQSLQTGSEAKKRAATGGVILQQRITNQSFTLKKKVAIMTSYINMPLPSSSGEIISCFNLFLKKQHTLWLSHSQHETFNTAHARNVSKTCHNVSQASG